MVQFAEISLPIALDMFHLAAPLGRFVLGVLSLQPHDEGGGQSFDLSVGHRILAQLVIVPLNSLIRPGRLLVKAKVNPFITYKDGWIPLDQ